jgi:zinc protease
MNRTSDLRLRTSARSLLFHLSSLALVSCSLIAAHAQVAKKGGKPEDMRVFGQNLVTLPSSSPLCQIQIMARTGSADDPQGKEGTANVVANALIEGGFGNTKSPVTKEKLAEITRAWGDAALPSVRVDKETTTFTMTVPREALSQFISQVLQPMFTQPQWQQAELDRLRREALAEIESRLRFEDQESLGLETLDNWLFPGTNLDHLTTGTVQGLKAITREDLANFYKQYYQRGNMYVATSMNEPSQLGALMDALPAGEQMFMRPMHIVRAVPTPGRHLLIVTQPNAIATGLHLGFPFDLSRNDDEYWAMFVANVSFGLHRDDFGRLYHEIRVDRGYNYGDYSYIEYLSGRPFFLFPPPNTPRTHQYFSMWIRPVGTQYTHFLLKAMTAEFDRFVKQGLTPEDVAEAKVKARTLYLNYAESLSRQLGYRLDDMFYGMKNRGYLQQMLTQIDAVTPQQANAAIRKYLQTDNLKFVIVTNESEGQKLADEVAGGNNVTSKSLAEYHISEPIPPEKKALLDQDEQWKSYPLNIPRENIQVVKAADLFETAGEPGGGK